MITAEQIKEIKKFCNKNKINNMMMTKIIHGCVNLQDTTLEDRLLNNSELRIFNKLLKKYSVSQLDVLCRGILLDIDVTSFSHPSLAFISMHEAIQYELEKKENKVK